MQFTPVTAVLMLSSYATYGIAQVPSPSHVSAPRNDVSGDYMLGAGDVISIAVADAPEYSAKIRIADSGLIRIASLPLISAAGLTTTALADRVAEGLRTADLLRNPSVSVFVEEFHSSSVTVLGAVAKPSVYSLQRSTTLLEMLSVAGGLLPTAGTTATVVREKRDGEMGAAERETITVDLSRLLTGKDLSSNLVLRPRDVISISAAPVVYVVGAVGRSGGYVLPEAGGQISVLRALAMAEGLKPIAASKSASIIRRAEQEGSQRTEIPVNLDALLANTQPDIILQANDILFVPESGSKKRMQKAGEIAVQAVSGIAIYGIGYRIGTH